MLKNSPKIHWVAHRGDCQHHIENTLESIKTAIDNGIEHIEIDVQLTQEGLPIVFHDNNLKAMLNLDTCMAKVNFKNINKQPLTPRKKTTVINSHYYTPLLSQVVSLIQQFPKVTLYVEVKNINFYYFSYQHVYKTITETLNPIMNQVVIIGFSYRFLRLVKNNSTLPIAYVLPSWQHYSTKMLSKLKPEIIFADINIIPNTEKFHAKKETWIVYEVSNIEQAKQLIEQGIYGFESFTPSLLKTISST